MTDIIYTENRGNGGGAVIGLRDRAGAQMSMSSTVQKIVVSASGSGGGGVELPVEVLTALGEKLRVNPLKRLFPDHSRRALRFESPVNPFDFRLGKPGCPAQGLETVRSVPRRRF